MSLVDNVLSFLKRKKKEDLNDAPEGVCPNCFGRQEFGGKFYEAIKKDDVDVNDKETSVGWVQDYVNKNFKDIELHNHDGALVCNKCKVAYRQT